ncbi:MAG: hypothetical protein EBU75_02900, partial [Betaproteobacteria bacterium]|nr:hypothetical protein [Betaproteobacteria bacterium]
MGPSWLKTGWAPLATLALKPWCELRLDADVLAALRASGDGWQTRV